MNVESLLQTISIYAIPVLLAITLHEVAHGYVARLCGDNTAWAAGRITLNPLNHVDPFGTLVLPLLVLLSTNGAYSLGYAKTVPVNIGRLRRPRTQQFWVILAGPMANLAQALAWLVLLTALGALQVEERFLLEMTRAGVVVNLVMWAFNLFPVPPLDGGRILMGLLSYRHSQLLARIEPFGFFIVLALLVLGVVSTVWVDPLVSIGLEGLKILITPLLLLLS